MIEKGQCSRLSTAPYDIYSLFKVEIGEPDSRGNTPARYSAQVMGIGAVGGNLNGKDAGCKRRNNTG